MKKLEFNVPGYEGLAAVLHDAYHQAATGKGKDRHVKQNEPFEHQVMIEGARRFGSGSLLYQAFKKSEESQRMGLDRGVAELLGAIVYLAGAVMVRQEMEEAVVDAEEVNVDQGPDSEAIDLTPDRRWRRWFGLGTMPFPVGTKISIILRSGEQFDCLAGDAFSNNWTHLNGESDIEFFRARY